MFLPSNITLKFGDSGDFVAELQRRLAIVHCFSNDQVNGFYDGATVNGVMQFQGMSGLHADGVAGPETLRRLNGVIAGDSSGSDDKKEEEAKLEASQAGQINMALAEQQPAPAMWGEPAQEAAPAHAAPAATPGLDPAMFVPAAAAAAAFIPSPQDQAELAQRSQISQNPAQDLSDLLAAAQQQQQSVAAAPPIAQPRPPEPQALAPQAEPIPVYAAPQALQPVPVAPPVAEPVMAEPQGIVARAGRFANAMMQKLSDYFEAKLPPSVMAEVKAAGAVMAASGMKEAPIPTGPEMGGPAQQIPARGPEQQPAQIR